MDMIGEARYKGEDMTFSLEENELTLTSKKPENIIKTFERVFTHVNNNEEVVNEVIIGSSYPYRKAIVFFCNGVVGYEQDSYTLPVECYFEFDSDKITPISKITIASKELNYLFDVSQAIAKRDWNIDGAWGLVLEEYSKSKSGIEYFEYHKKKVGINFAITRIIGKNLSPITLQSIIELTFEETNDYDFIAGILYYVKLSIIYFCYRQDVYLSEIILKEKGDGKKYKKTGTMVLLKQNDNNIDIESDKLKKKIMPVEYVKGHIGDLINNLINNKLYVEHIPDDYNDINRITAGRFVLLTAAFEWEFRQCYPNGIKHREATHNARKRVKKRLEEIIDQEANKKTRGIYKRLLNNVNIDTLESKVRYWCNENSELITLFGNQLYKINHEEFSIKGFGMELQQQRNNFAHGNLDREFHGIALLEIMLLERMIYMIQLHRIGLNDEDIQKSVSSLFDCKI